MEQYYNLYPKIIKNIFSIILYMDNKKCTQSTVNNPYMNYLPFDDPTKSKACTDNDDLVKENFYTGTVSDPTKQWSGTNFDRYFFTQPITESVSDLNTFLDFVYPNADTCRESNYNCFINMDTTTSFDRLVFEPGTTQPNYQNVTGLYDKIKTITDRVDEMEQSVNNLNNRQRVKIRNNIVNEINGERTSTKKNLHVGGRGN